MERHGKQLRAGTGHDVNDPWIDVAIKQPHIDAGVSQENGSDYDSRRVTLAEEVAGLAKAPLSTQPGTNREYGLSVDVLGRVVEAVSGLRLNAFLDQRLFVR